MDRALDDIIGDRRGQQPRSDSRYRDRRPPRDGVRKPENRRDESRNLDSDWVHDRFDDNEARGPRRGGRAGAPTDYDRRRPQYNDQSDGGSRIKVDNLHYDLTEEDIRELFSRKGQVTSVQLLYDRSDRSRGIAYVVMADSRDARDAVRDFDGANANNQPIRVSLILTAPSSRSRNPFDSAERPARSLFDRVEKRSRSDSPPNSRTRRSDVTGPAPENIDRYTPGGGGGRSRGTGREGRRDDSSRGGRRPGERRGGPRNGGESNGRPSQARPKKTQQELDAEMEDYWGHKEESSNNATSTAEVPVAAIDGDVDMIE